MRKAVFCFALLLLLACNAPQHDAVPTGVKTPDDTGLAFDTAQTYRTAIADYIETMSKRDGSFPDTVYIGRHADFPHIELPNSIGNTTIRILTPAEGEALRDGARFAYLNIFATFTPGTVEFFVVRFQQGMRHHPDGRDDRHLYYGIGRARELKLESVTM